MTHCHCIGVHLSPLKCKYADSIDRRFGTQGFKDCGEAKGLLAWRRRLRSIAHVK